MPYTSLWEKLKRENRLLNLPPDFFYINGFQPFKHPHFRPGFVDMLPLIRDIHEFICKELGDASLSIIKFYENIRKPCKSIKYKIKFFKSIYNLLFHSWKERLNPNSEQISKYLEKLN